MVIADYDNGVIVLSKGGDVVRHLTVADDKAACGVVTTVDGSRIVVLGYKASTWTINIFTSGLELIETVLCPDDAMIETWAMRKVCIAEDNQLYLMASGEHKLVIWSFNLTERTWRTLVTEGSRQTAYADFSVRIDKATDEMHFLLCDASRAQLSLVAVTRDIELANIQNVKMRRHKGQEWVVQGPRLAVYDPNGDLLVYDGSGKLFLFDGAHFRCRRIVADLGRGEVGALGVNNHGWCFALCRHRLTIEAHLYLHEATSAPAAETSL